MGELTVKDVGEFGLIRRIMHDFIYRPELVKVGPGDDGAVYAAPPGFDQVISTDTMVEGIHFTKETMGPSDVGYHLGASNFSDMAAMGAEASGFVLSIALPDDLPLSWVESFYGGLRSCCRKYRVNLLGGDVTGSPGGVIVTGTVIGMVPSGKAVTRSGAREGDVVFVTETIGDSAAGLYALLHGRASDFPGLVRRHRRPEPQIRAGILLRDHGAHALNDISDGLSRELNEIAAASEVEIEIDPSKIPISGEARRLAEEVHVNPLDWAFNGGEDYELVGSLSPADFDTIREECAVRAIGRVVRKPGRGVYIRKGKERAILEVHGFDHFEK
ncbi:thiamine-phosphate kinase [Dialister sp.]|jgi:thiamine-monophosphate kinase|uniref:thiamine-phosphate kinase n=1 Tax=Dialister sp. TaxID=1955814 RepID=UPI003A5BE51E